MKILINQRGGLGNQLFQYAAGIYFATKYNASLEIIREPEHRAVSSGHPRPFLLSQFNISALCRERTQLDRILRSKSQFTAPASRPARLPLRARLHNPEYLVVSGFQPSIPQAVAAKRLYINGYFQAHQYAQEMEAKLRNELTFREAPRGNNRVLLDKIQECECPVSVHIRSGDFRKEKGGIDVLPLAYHHNAISSMCDAHTKPTFFVFSDDVVFAREHLRRLGQMFFVDNNNEETAHEDLRLMAACRHHIIANSTFSWWGAWLNPHPHKDIIFPNRWLDRAPPHPDLIPPSWRPVSVDEMHNPPLIRRD